MCVYGWICGLHENVKVSNEQAKMCVWMNEFAGSTKSSEQAKMYVCMYVYMYGWICELHNKTFKFLVSK
jgi:hypothetical protein